jgi:hypothetical protein
MPRVLPGQWAVSDASVSVRLPSRPDSVTAPPTRRPHPSNTTPQPRTKVRGERARSARGSRAAAPAGGSSRHGSKVSEWRFETPTGYAPTRPSTQRVYLVPPLRRARGFYNCWRQAQPHLPQSVVSGAGDVDRVAFLLETRPEEAGHLDLILTTTTRTRTSRGPSPARGGERKVRGRRLAERCRSGDLNPNPSP